jgi:hypothetical protein
MFGRVDDNGATDAERSRIARTIGCGGGTDGDPGEHK